MRKKLAFLTPLLFILLASMVYGSLSFTANRPTNQTVYDNNTNFMFNITLNDSIIGDCIYQVGLTNGTIVGNTTMVNSSNTWFNDSLTLTDSAYGSYHNVTYFCNESGAYNQTKTVWFKSDETAPSVSHFAPTIYNTSASDGNFVNVLANVSDTTDTTINVTILNEAGSVVDVFTPTTTSAAQDVNATYNLTYSDFGSADGFYTLRVNATDEAGNSGNGDETLTIQSLQANTWNLLSQVEANENMVTWATKVPSLSYISTLDNEYKNFTTFQVGTSTYNTSTVTKGYGVYVYPSSTVTLMRDWDASGGVSQDLKTNGWNLLGINDDQHTLQDVCDKNAKVSYVSYHNATDDVYYSHKCDWNINNVTVDRGQGVWVLTTGNISVTI